MEVVRMIALVAMVMVVLLMSMGRARGDFSTDEKECENALVGMSACLSYVTGTGDKPNEDCCNGLREVMKTSPKCLCILIKDRNDPQLGFKIDAAKSMSLPATCNVHANISHCPALLHMDPNSKDAQVFNQLGGSNNGTNSTGIQSGVPSSSTLPSGGTSVGDQPKTSGAADIIIQQFTATVVWIFSFAALLLT
ncbi:non-specific lipid transfer protein GPI-anchored 14-like [Wolffia australiana]